MNRSLEQRYATLANNRMLLKDFGLTFGQFKRGKNNLITDVPGVKVGHATIIEGTGKRKPGTGPIRTGVTIIQPNDNIFEKKLFANAFILNGAGEMSGITQVQEWGLIETPIGLTNTMSVGKVADSIAGWMAQKYPEIQQGKQVVIPVVGECDDSFLNDSAGSHVKRHHVLKAIEAAAPGPFLQGSVGAGTGMICCDFKGGIGSSSRVVPVGGKNFNLGVLVLSNFGEIEDLRFDGMDLGRRLKPKFSDYKKRRDNYGSIICVIATDLPLSVIQIGRICKRAALAIGRAGSYAAHGSGEIVLGFSTANVVETSSKKSFYKVELCQDTALDPVYQATIETTEEAIINSLLQSVDMSGVEDHFVPALPLGELQGIIEKYSL